MLRKTIIDAVTATLTSLLNIRATQLSVTSRLVEDLKVDDLDAVEIITDLEDALDVEIEASEFHELKTVGDLVDLLEKKGMATNEANGDDPVCRGDGRRS